MPTGHITAREVAREEWPDKSDANFARRMVSMKAFGRCRTKQLEVQDQKRDAQIIGGGQNRWQEGRGRPRKVPQSERDAQIKLTANIGLGNGGQHHAPTRPFRGKLVLNRSRESMASSLSRLTTRSNTDRASRALDEACWIAAR